MESLLDVSFPIWNNSVSASFSIVIGDGELTTKTGTGLFSGEIFSFTDPLFGNFGFVFEPDPAETGGDFEWFLSSSSFEELNVFRRTFCKVSYNFDFGFSLLIDPEVCSISLLGGEVGIKYLFWTEKVLDLIVF